MAELVYIFDTVTGQRVVKLLESAHVTDGAVVSGKLGVGSVISGYIASGQVGTPHIAAQSVLSAQLGATVIGGAHVYSGSVFPALTFSGDIILGANKFKTTSMLLKETADLYLSVRTVADDAWGNFHAENIFIRTALIDPGTETAYLAASNNDGYKWLFKARKTGVGLVTVLSLYGAADPYAQADLALRLLPIATASLPGTPVEGMLTYDATLDKLTYRDSAAWRLIVEETLTQTLTNKRITKRVGTVASSATPTPAGDDVDVYTVTALAEAATFGAPTGTPTNGQTLIIRVLDNGTARVLAWNAIYRASSDLALPTTTTLSKTLYCGFCYNSAATKWDLLAVLDNL